MLRTLKAIRNSIILRFEGVTDALWYGVVNIESAEVRIGVAIPQPGEIVTQDLAAPLLLDVALLGLLCNEFVAVLGRFVF